MSQAWLITKEYIENNRVIEVFVALLDSAIPSDVMLSITDELYNTFFQSEAHLPSFDAKRATYPILNDGSLHTAYIVRGHNPSLSTRRVYDIVIDTDGGQASMVHWREPHIVVESEMHKVEYWEEFSVAMLTVDRSDTNS
jgi:hypothetical protein